MLGNNNQTLVRNWALAFVGLAIYNLFAHWFRGAFVFLAGEQMTYRIRTDLFWRILHQPAAWFDEPAHSKSIVAHRLGIDATKARDLVGDSTSLISLIGVTIAGGVLVAFIFCWRTAAVVLALLPFMSAGAILFQKIALASGEEDARACESCHGKTGRWRTEQKTNGQPHF